MLGEDPERRKLLSSERSVGSPAKVKSGASPAGIRHPDSCRRAAPHLLGQTRGLAHRAPRLRLPRRRPGSSVDSPLLSFCLVRPFLRHPLIGSYASPLLHTGSRKRFYQRPEYTTLSRRVKRLNTRYSIRHAPRGTSGTQPDSPPGLDSESPTAAGRSPARIYRSRCCGF